MFFFIAANGDNAKHLLISACISLLLCDVRGVVDAVREVAAQFSGVEVVIVDGKRMRRVVRRVGDAPSSGGKRVRRVRVIKRRRSFEAVH